MVGITPEKAGKKHEEPLLQRDFRFAVLEVLLASATPLSISEVRHMLLHAGIYVGSHNTVRATITAIGSIASSFIIEKSRRITRKGRTAVYRVLPTQRLKTKITQCSKNS